MRQGSRYFASVGSGQRQTCCKTFTLTLEPLMLRLTSFATRPFGGMPVISAFGFTGVAASPAN